MSRADEQSRSTTKDGLEFTFWLTIANVPKMVPQKQPDGSIKNVPVQYDAGPLYHGLPPIYGPILQVKNVTSRVIFILSRYKNDDEQQLLFGIPDNNGNIVSLDSESLADPLQFFVTPLKPGESCSFAQRLEADQIKAIGTGSVAAGIYLTTLDPNAAPNGVAKTKPMDIAWSKPVKLPVKELQDYLEKYKEQAR
jgi:hypothetical protein